MAMLRPSLRVAWGRHVVMLRRTSSFSAKRSKADLSGATPGTDAQRWQDGASNWAESQSKRIFKGSAANKVGLSKDLDGTLKSHHDMKTFGLGFARSCASLEEYVQFTTAHYHFYKAMEDSFRAQSSDSPMGRLWRTCPELHGAPQKLVEDLNAVGIDAMASKASPATLAYVDGIERAATIDEGSPLIGHFYTRYFADLFGGSMLGYPTRLALGLEIGTPRFYRFPTEVEDDRRQYIERLYEAINDEGDKMAPDVRKRVVTEAEKAFDFNAAVYSERPRMLLGAVHGGLNIAVGIVGNRLRGGK